jgi:protein-tyrosine phosphatase
MYCVLFVCSANICRSPTAEGVFRQIVTEADLAARIGADSVGLYRQHAGEPPDRRAVETAKARGYEIGNLRARQITMQDFADFHLILAMDSSHYRQLLQVCPQGAERKLAMFLETAPQFGRIDVPDPYCGAHGFEYVMDLIEAGAQGWLNRIRRERYQNPPLSLMRG